jgi:succinylglutamate desuccinylase
MDIISLFKRFAETKLLFESSDFLLTEIDEYAYRVKSRSGNALPGRRILLTALVHGDETGGIEALYQCAQEFIESALLGAELTIALGNMPAARLGRRFIERDLNRSFAVTGGQELEHRLARRLEELVADADVVIDFHQTVQPSESAFLIFQYSKSNMDLAKAIAGENAVVTYRGDFSKDGTTLGVYALSKNKTAVTFEMGHLGLSQEQALKSRLLFKKSLAYLANKNAASSTTETETSVFTFAKATVPSAPGRSLKSGFQNFSKISKNQVIAEDPSGPIAADQDGFMLFPKYDELALVSAELCRLVTPLSPEEISGW